MKKGRLLELVWQELVTKTDELTAFSRATISGTMTEFKKHRKPPATGVILVGVPNLPTETDVHQSLLWEESIRLLPPKRLLSLIYNWIVQFRPKLFTVSSINPDIVEEPPSRNLAFHYQHSNRFKWWRDHKGWYVRLWKQVIFSEEVGVFFIFPTAGRVYVWRQTNWRCIQKAERGPTSYYINFLWIKQVV